MLSTEDWAAIKLTLELATVTTVLLLVLCTPLAWWLAHTASRWKGPVGAVVALPLVLPPTVIGFYLLVTMGPNGPVGQLTEWLALALGGRGGGSVIGARPVAVQPLQRAFENLGRRPLEVAATLGASKLDTFFTVVLPMARTGFVTAAVLSFAHTVGEFGVVLMIGGNIPGVTRVVSVQIYDHVEAMDYASAHWLAGGMVVFSFVVLMLLHWLQPSKERA